jgi:hypothetical protein
MPEVIQKTLVTGATSTGAKTAVDMRNITNWSVYVAATGGTSAAFQIEVTTDPAGVNGWGAAAMRAQGSGTYATTAVTVTAGTGVSRFFEPQDNIAWVRVNLTAVTGSTVNAVLLGEM